MALTPSQGTATSLSNFKEHPSIAVPPHNSSLERSRFLPDSPPEAPEQIFSLGRVIFIDPLRSRRFDPEKGTAGNSSSSSQRSQPSIKDRIDSRVFSASSELAENATPLRLFLRRRDLKRQCGDWAVYVDRRPSMIVTITLRQLARLSDTVEYSF